MADLMSTPVNTLSRDNLSLLITDNIMNNSIESFSNSGCDVMETDSPIRKPKGLPIGKKLFHSPIDDCSNEVPFTRTSVERKTTAKKRKQLLIPEINKDRIEKAYVMECVEEVYSPDVKEGMRRKVISLLYNKSFYMELRR